VLRPLNIDPTEVDDGRIEDVATANLHAQVGFDSLPYRVERTSLEIREDTPHQRLGRSQEDFSGFCGA